MAVIKPGEIKNPKGRGKGTKNKKTLAWEALGKYLTEDGARKYKAELLRLKGKEYLDAYNKMLEFFKPKLSRTQGMVSNFNYDISNMPKEYIDRLAKANTEAEMIQIIAEYESITNKS